MATTLTSSKNAAAGLSLLHSGKVRDVYEVDTDHLLLVATDRLSAFDCILPTPIKNKGAILTALSDFWFKKLGNLTDHHLVTADFDQMPDVVRQNADLRGRSMLVKRTKVFPVECVVRGYLEGSGWKDYLAAGEICGHKLPAGMQQCERLPGPIFTPSTKAAEGHDQNITEEEFYARLGEETASELKSRALAVYTAASEYALSKGIIIADTKFEFGRDADGKILLIDEVLTPDSSRFWEADKYSPGNAQASYDKQFVREYLETLDWNKQYPAPGLPDDIAEATTQRYLQAYKILTGRDLS